MRSVDEVWEECKWDREIQESGLYNVMNAGSLFRRGSNLSLYECGIFYSPLKLSNTAEDTINITMLNLVELFLDEYDY